MLIAFACLGLGACGPNEKQKEELAKRKRIECLDKICPGDVEPPRDYTKDALLKLNGQWFIGPKYYSNSGINGASFSWPSKKSREDVPQDERDGTSDISIFFRHHDGVMHGLNRIDILKQAEKEGRLVSKKMIRPSLEQWRIKEPGELDPGVWYVAINHVEKEPNAAVLWCRDRDPNFDICTTGNIFNPGIAWDLRFSAKHAQDCSEIFLEATRVLQLLIKV